VVIDHLRDPEGELSLVESYRASCLLEIAGPANDAEGHGIDAVGEPEQTLGTDIASARNSVGAIDRHQGDHCWEKP
jgi:hypothetical protein